MSDTLCRVARVMIGAALCLVAPGGRQVMVGESSRDIRLRADVTVK